MTTTYDPFVPAGASGDGGTGGRFESRPKSLDEFSGDCNIPILKDLAFPEIFEISIAARY